MDVRIPIPSGGEMPAYIALPRRPGAGVVVIQEIFGITQNMIDTCNWLASRQFVAVCPEIFWRTDPGLVIGDYNVEQTRAARAKVNDDTASYDIAAPVSFLRKHPIVHAGGGLVGYFLGRLVSYLSAPRQHAH